MRNLFFSAFIIVVIAVSGCTAQTDIGPNTTSATSSSAAKITDADVQNFEKLRAELQVAQQSGEISPQTYVEIDGKVRELENKGYDKGSTDELRALLSQLSVGGQEPTTTIRNEPRENVNSTSSSVVIWQYMDDKWKPTGTPPMCPEPMIFQSPVDLDLVSSIIYPGQVRSGDFKPHGGFRTDGAQGPIEVRAPMEGYIVDVAHFYDEFGIHYMYDIQHPCGIMHRIGHLSAVPPKLQAVFDTVPQGKYHDSRTHPVEPFFVGLGETLATDIQQGAGFDWGVYDLRKENNAAKDPAFREAHKDEPWQAYYAFCWFDYLPANDEAIVRSLPAADGVSGKTSAYCS